MRILSCFAAACQSVSNEKLMLDHGSGNDTMRKKEMRGETIMTRIDISGKHEHLVLRRAVPDDAANIIAFLNQAAGESDNLMFGSGEFSVPVEQEKELIEQMLQSKGELFLVAEIAGQIVGTLTFLCGKRERNRHAGEFGMTVLKRYWGNGIGKSMLRYLIQWAKDGGQIRKINLRVRSDNERAIRLYKGQGFVVEGLLRREFCINGIFYDAYAMGLMID
jgi:RimJ/RimL family protein N-acetyltransferase